MNKEQTRKRIDDCYKDIERAKAIIESIRKECKHEEFEDGNYMWAPGHINHTRICKACDTPLGEQGSYTFKFHNISQHKDALLSIVKENFLKTGVGNFVVFSDTQEPSIDFNKEDYTITADRNRCISFKDGNFKLEQRSVEECESFANKIVSVCQEAGIKVEILPYII